jgi:hypothetical protein
VSDAAGLDPLGFVTEVLAARGALVEGDDREALALLPVSVARALAVPEELRLAVDPGRPGTVPCGFGAPLLEMLTKEARATVPVAWVSLEGRPPPVTLAESVAHRFSLRNGLAQVIDAAPGEAVYLVAHFAVTGEADDRYDTNVCVVLEVEGDGEPDDPLKLMLDPLRPSPSLVPVPQRTLSAGIDCATIRATLAAREALSTFRTSVARRKGRDRLRIDEYFAALIADARAPRRPVPEASIRAKLEHLDAEHRQKRSDLDARFTVRAAVTPIALVIATVPVTRVRVRLRRRKAEADLMLTIPAEGRNPDRLACAGCPRTTLRPVACDDRLHLLCETCAPSANGRPRCPACTGRR